MEYDQVIMLSEITRKLELINKKIDTIIDMKQNQKDKPKLAEGITKVTRKPIIQNEEDEELTIEDSEE